MASPLIDPAFIAEIRAVEQSSGQSNVVSSLVSKLEAQLVEFADGFAAHLARGDASAAARAAHTMKGSCHQLGAAALGDLFGAIESSVKAGDYADAQRRVNDGSGLITRSIEALKRA